jgi:hypothetical protein
MMQDFCARGVIQLKLCFPRKLKRKGGNGPLHKCGSLPKDILHLLSEVGHSSARRYPHASMHLKFFMKLSTPKTSKWPKLTGCAKNLSKKQG